MNREVMQQALDALENPNAGLVPHEGNWRSIQAIAIAALRAELAKDTEPVGYFAYNANWRTWENVVSAAKNDPDVFPLFRAQPDYAAGRNDGLEHAAAICDAEASIEGIAQRCAEKIRALKGE